MPGPIVHLQNVGGLPPYLRDLGGKHGAQIADLLDADPCSPYAGFGAQGPDFLLFSLKEYGTPLDDLVNSLFKVDDALEPFVDFVEEVIKPVEAAIEKAVDAVDQAVFDGLISQIGATSNLMSTTLHSYLAKLVTDHVDLFYPFYPKIQQGKPPNDWYWFDVLHYRRTGRFASTLWSLAQGDDDLMRYAVGYGSHVGGDVAGHPFVNAIVGGPYRSHWHRHHLVENWIDAYARRNYPDSAQTKACLALGPDDTYVSDAVSGSYYYRLCQFPDDRLPDKLQKLLFKAFDSVYTGNLVPPMLSPDDLDSTYRLWLAWFERMTTIGAAQQPTPIAPPGAAAAALISSFVNGLPSFPGGSGGPGGGFSLANLFTALSAFVDWLTQSLAYAANWIAANSAAILALPKTEALALVKWLLYQVQKFVWSIYEETRFALVLGAYLVPEPRDFNRVPWGTAFINTNSAGLTGGPAPSFLDYPRKQETHDQFGPMEHHLAYPGTVVENPFAEAAPELFYGKNPDVVLAGLHPYDPQVEQTYAAKAPYGSGPTFTHWTDQNTWSGAQFGSIRAFTARLLSGFIDDLPNFNLDSDRGYAWKTWTPDSPEIDVQPTVPVTYTDP